MKAQQTKKTQKFYSHKNSLTKLVMWFYDGNKRTFYSDLRYDKRGIENGVKKLETLVEVKFKGTYKTAIIYENLNGQELKKWIDGKRVL